MGNIPSCPLIGLRLRGRKLEIRFSLVDLLTANYKERSRDMGLELC